MAAIEYLSPREIALDIAVSTRWEALRAVGTLIETSRGLSAPPIFRALWRREQAQSTALGHGVALPHARIMGISEPVTAYLRARNAISFAAPDRGAVSELFAVLVPEGADNAAHLDLLALIAEMFSDSAFRSRLTAANDVTSVRNVFDRWVGAHKEGQIPLAVLPATADASGRGMLSP